MSITTDPPKWMPLTGLTGKGLRHLGNGWYELGWISGPKPAAYSVTPTSLVIAIAVGMQGIKNHRN